MAPIDLANISKKLLSAEPDKYVACIYLSIKNVDDNKPADADCSITHVTLFEGGLDDGLVGFEVAVLIGKQHIFLSGKVADVFPYIGFFPYVYRDALCTNGAPSVEDMDGMRKVESVFDVPQGTVNVRLSSLNIWFQLDLGQILEKIARFAPKRKAIEVASLTVLSTSFEWDL